MIPVEQEENKPKENSIEQNISTVAKLKQKRKSRTHTEIIMKKKPEFLTKDESNKKNTIHKKSEDVNALLMSPNFIDENEKNETEVNPSLANKKKINLKVTPPIKPSPFDPISEIKSSDKVMDVNKSKVLENIINSHLYRCLIFSPFVTESIFKRHLTLTYRGLIYAKKCLKEPSKAFLKSKLVNLVDSKR